MSPRTVVALDVETADEKHTRICSIALVRIEDGKIVTEWDSLVRPPDPPAPRNVEIHGLSWRELHDAPSFAEVWKIVLGLLEGADAVVAHWAQFDRGALERNCALEGQPALTLPWLCTVDLGKKAWPQLPNHKLLTLAGHLGIELHHHEALSDAQACARIYLAAQRILIPASAPAPALPAKLPASEQRIGTDGAHRWIWEHQPGASLLTLDGKPLVQLRETEGFLVVKVIGEEGFVFEARVSGPGLQRRDDLVLEALRFAVLAARARRIQLSGEAWKKIVEGRPAAHRRAA
jgi:DNA polymerase-3 subunit epsilon